MNLFLQYSVNGLAIGMVSALLGVGFAMSQVTGVFNFGFGADYAVSAFFFYTLVTRFSCPWIIALPVAIICGGLLGGLEELLVFAPLRRKNASDTAAMLSSMGTYLILTNVLAVVYGNENHVLWFNSEVSIRVWKVVITESQLEQFWVGGAILTIALLIAYRSPLGLYLRGAGNNPALLQVLGVNPYWTWLFAHILAGMLAAGAACLYCLDEAIDPYIGMRALLFGAVAALASGRRGRFKRAAALGFAIGISQSLLSLVLPQRWIDTAIYVLLVFLLVGGKPRTLRHPRPEGTT